MAQRGIQWHHPTCAFVLAASVLAGCSVGPDYVRPSAELPTAYAPFYPLPEGGQVAIDPTWWRAFQDDTLNRLITQALDHNGDLRVAIARVAEAQAALNEVGASFFPEIDLEMAGRNTKNSSKAASNAANGKTPSRTESRTASLTTAYELDVWGRSRRASESARARLLASQYGRDALRLSVAGLVATHYLNLRALDATLALAQATRGSQAESRDILKKRVDAGLSSQFDLVRTDAALAMVDAQLASVRGQRAQREHALGLLTGTPSLSITPGDVRSLPLLPLPPAGLPADLIESRPDVRQAEQTLIAANAGIGLAKAAYFPRLSLTGRLGVESQDLSDLLAAGASTGSLGVGMMLPILDFGKTTAQVAGARARTDQSWGQYQNTVQTAFTEVRDALVAVRERSSLEAAQQLRMDRQNEALQLATRRYEAGYSPYLEVLDAQRGYNEATTAWVEARRARLAAGVDLFKALGGGWQSQP